MASKNTIGIVLAVQGEKEFNQALQNSRKEAGSLKSELNLLSAEYDGNANSLEYLQKKQQILEKQTKSYADSVKTAERALSNAQDNQKKAAENYEKLAKELTEARAEMAKMSSEGKEGSKEYKDQSTKVEALAKAVERQAAQCDKAAGKVSDWSTKLNNAKTNLTSTNAEIKQNEQYLNEAANSTDQCAKSIDEYGKATEAATKTTSTWGDALKNAVATKGVSTAVDAIKDGVTAAANAVKESMVDISSATSSLAAQTGLTGTALEEYKSVMEEIKGDNFGESYEEVAAAMGLVYQNMGKLSATDMTHVTESLMTLEDTFDMDMNETLRGAQSLVSHFGVSASEAFDYLAAGAQAGLNYTDELGDNLSEYAGKFAEAGYSVEEYFQLLENGSEGGAYNLDKINDAINEVTTRLADGTVEDSLDLFSESTQDTFEAWKEGGATQKDVIDAIVSDIQTTTNEQEKMNKAAKAFGTMAEDGGTQFIESLTSVGDAFDDVQGKMDDLMDVKYDNLTDAWEGLGAAVQENFVTPIAEKAVPIVTSFAKTATSVVEGIGDAFSEPESELDNFISEISSANEEVATLINNAKSTVSGAEGDVAELEAYKSVLLDLNEQESLTEFQKYQLQSAVEALGDSVPGLTDAFNAETGTLSATNAELEEMFNNAENVAMQNAIIEAQSDLYEALAEATINKAKADSAAATAAEDLQAIEAKNADTADYLAGGYGDYYAEVMDAASAQDDATKAQEDANAALEEAQSQIDSNKEALDGLAEEYGLATEQNEETADSVSNTTEALEEAEQVFDEYGNNITGMSEEQAAAVTAISEAYEEMRDSISDAIEDSISMFDEFSGGTEVTAEQIQSNLDSQIEGITQWSENMQTLAAQVGNGMSQEMYDSIAQMGPESANLVQTLVDALQGETGEFESIASSWAQAMQLKDEASVVAGYTSAGQAAGEGMSSGISAAESEVVSTATEVGESAKSAVEEAASGAEVTVISADSITEGAGDITAAAASLGQAAADGIAQTDLTSTSQEQVNQYVNAIKAGVSQSSSAAGALASAAKSAAASWSGSFYSVGVNMSSGLANGIRAGQSSVISAAIAVAAAGLRAAKSTLGIASPSRKFKNEVGKQISAGMALGISDNASLAGSAAEQMSMTVYNNATAWLAKYKKKQKTTLADEKYYWQQVANHTKAGSEAYSLAIAKMIKAGVSKTTKSGKKTKTKSDATYNSDIFSAAESYMSNLETVSNVSLNDQLNYWNAVKAQLKSGTDAWYDAQEKINSIRDSIGTVSNMSTLLSTYQTYFNMSAKAEMEYWDMVRRQYAEGTDERLEADKEYLDAREDYLDELKDLEDDYLEKVKDVNDQLADDIQDLTDKYKDELQSQKDAIMDAFDLFDEFESESESGKTLLFNIKTQAAGYEDWMQQIEELQSKGILNDDLMDTLIDQGPEISASIHALNSLTENELLEYNEAYLKKQDIAQEQAEKNTSELKKETEKQTAELKAQAEKDLAELKASYDSSVASVNTTISSELANLANQARTIAEDQTTALINGLGGTRKEGAEKTTVASAASTPSADTSSASAASAAAAPASDKVLDAINSGKALKSLSKKERKKHHDLYNYLYDNYKRAGSNTVYKAIAKALGVSVSKTVTSKQKTNILKALKKKGYASGGITDSDLTWMDEYLDTKGGEMIVRRSDNAILTRTKPGDQIIDANTTANLLRIGKYTPDDLADMVREKASAYSALNGIGSLGSTAQLSSLLSMGAAAEQERSTAALESIMNQVNDTLYSMLPYIQKVGQGSQIYLDGDKLVGGLSDRISTDLASRQRRTR